MGNSKQNTVNKAVKAPLAGTHIQIIACAGSGKTETLALRVAHILHEGTDPSSIVAFTFTEKAAVELKQRILDRSCETCGPLILGRIGRMYVGTIHSYALRLLQTYAPRYAGYDLIDEAALPAWVARHCYTILGTRSWTGLWDRISEFLHDADMIENEGLSPLGTDDFSERYRTFVATLDSHRLLTFGRSIASAVEELQRKDVKTRIHKDIRFVLVDEYQDVNPAQEKLIRGLVGPHAQLCVVGDDDQSIYQWRGSDVAIMQGFQKRYHPALQVDLGTNRRSVPSIVKVAADFAATISPRLDKSIGQSRIELKTAHPVRVLTPTNREEEAKEIAYAIQALRKSGWHAAQIAILIRQWRQAPLILEALRALGIPSDCGGGNSLFTTEFGYLLAAGYLIGIGWGVPHGWKQSHLPAAPTSQIEWAKQLGALLHLSKEQQSAAKAWITSFSNEAQGEGTRPASLVEDLYDLARAIGVRNWNLTVDCQRLWFGTFGRFSQVLASYEKARLSGRWVRNGDVLEFRGGQDRGVWFYRGLAHFLNGYALDTSSGYTSPPDPNSPAVQITTIHSSKGLQWPVVFLPGLEHGKFPSSNVGTIGPTEVPTTLISKAVLKRYAGSDADERRLFYVAITRARDLLVVSCPKRANVNSVSPSPFFEFVQCHKKTWSPESGIGNALSPDQPDSFHPQLPSLTFSELALYGNCPYGYRLATEFDVATPIARDMGYGKSIHHILRRIADLVKSTGRIPDRLTVENLFDSEFHIPYTNTVGHAKMKVAAQKLVNTYIDEQRSELECVWEVERPFELHLESVTIVGRADIIIDSNKRAAPKLTIIDYKTFDTGAYSQTVEDQLRTYTAAARAEGFEVSGAIVHNLKDSERYNVNVDATAIDKTLSRANAWALGITTKKFAAKPEERKCDACDYCKICSHRAN